MWCRGAVSSPAGPLELLSQEKAQVGEPRQVTHFLMKEPNRTQNPGNQAATFYVSVYLALLARDAPESSMFTCCIPRSQGLGLRKVADFESDLTPGMSVLFPRRT